MITWVFFDLGGTLLDDSELFASINRVYLDLVRAHGYNVSIDEFAAVRDLLIARHEHPLFLRAVLSFVRDDSVAESIRREAAERLRDTEVAGQRAFPEAPGVLGAISRHASLGVIANQYRTVRDVLRRDGLDSFFRVVAISAEAGVSKPDPAIFTRALREAGCRPAEAVMVGDRVDNDIAPAKALGLHTVRVRWGVFRNQEPLRPDQRPDVEVPSLRDVPRAIEKIRAPV